MMGAINPAEENEMNSKDRVSLSQVMNPSEIMSFIIRTSDLKNSSSSEDPHVTSDEQICPCRQQDTFSF